MDNAPPSPSARSEYMVIHILGIELLQFPVKIHSTQKKREKKGSKNGVSSCSFELLSGVHTDTVMLPLHFIYPLLPSLLLHTSTLQLAFVPLLISSDKYD